MNSDTLHLLKCVICLCVECEVADDDKLNGMLLRCSLDLLEILHTFFCSRAPISVKILWPKLCWTSFKDFFYTYISMQQHTLYFVMKNAGFLHIAAICISLLVTICGSSWIELPYHSIFLHLHGIPDNKHIELRVYCCLGSLLIQVTFQRRSGILEIHPGLLEHKTLTKLIWQARSFLVFGFVYVSQGSTIWFLWSRILS